MKITVEIDEALLPVLAAGINHEYIYLRSERMRVAASALQIAYDDVARVTPAIMSEFSSDNWAEIYQAVSNGADYSVSISRAKWIGDSDAGYVTIEAGGRKWRSVSDDFIPADTEALDSLRGILDRIRPHAQEEQPSVGSVGL